jgi:urease accessory protein
LLQLADGRFPAGGHAHSAGMEEAVSSGIVMDMAQLTEFLRGRLWTVGLTTAALAAAACRASAHAASDEEWRELDHEVDVRMPSPAQRSASRRLGRQLVRTASTVWPSELLDGMATLWPQGPHHPLVLGAATWLAGAGPAEAAALAIHSDLMTPASAAVRLIGFDPVQVAAAVARLGTQAAKVVELAVESSAGGPADWPAESAPMLDVLAELHAARAEGNLFAS